MIDVKLDEVVEFAMRGIRDNMLPTDPNEQHGLFIQKVSEEAGEAARAWILYRGANPRKPQGTPEDVVSELGDTITAAMAAISVLGFSPTEVILEALMKSTERAAAVISA